MADYQSVLIICVDRDGDLEIKTGTKGPVIGREKVLKAAVNFAIADPTETDANVLFAGVRLFDGLKGRYPQVEVVALTGSRNVGVESDLIVSKQLDSVLNDIKVDGIILVSDGAEDEHVMPIIQSRAKVISIEGVVVRQSEALESTYYVILDVLKEVSADPKLARLVLGLPGIALILYMILGINAWRVIFGVFGILLVLKGFNVDDFLDRNIRSLKESLVTDKATFFTYIIASLVGLVGLIRGYQAIGNSNYATYIDAAPFFINASKDLLAAAGLLALTGRSLDAVIERRGLGKYLMIATFLVSLWFVVSAVSSFILRAITIGELVVSAIIGVGLSLTAFLLRKAASRGK